MKTRTGYLFKRNDIYYVGWKVNGKSFMKSTGTRNKRQAEQKRAEIMAPFALGDEIQTLRAVSAKLEGKQAELTRLEEKRNPPLSLDRAWLKYLESPNRPDSGPRTLQGYEGHFDQFLSWVKSKHPGVIALRDVNRQIAEEYTSHLVKRGVSPNTFNKHVRFLELFFRVLKDKNDGVRL